MSFLIESLSYKEQIKAILLLQKSFFNIFHDFWVFLNYFDTEPFYIALGCFAISFLGYRKGVKYLYFLCFSLFANHLAKVFCSMPRPFDFQEDIFSRGRQGQRCHTGVCALSQKRPPATSQP